MAEEAGEAADVFAPLMASETSADAMAALAGLRDAVAHRAVTLSKEAVATACRSWKASKAKGTWTADVALGYASVMKAFGDADQVIVGRHDDHPRPVPHAAPPSPVRAQSAEGGAGGGGECWGRR